jgi:hypothetical protein
VRLFDLLAASLALLAAVAAVLLRVPRLRRAVLRPRVPAAALLLSAASAVVRTSGASGTGTRTLHGFPKPFYATWTSWESAARSAGVSWLYFAGNTLAWLAAVCVAAVVWAAWARRGVNPGPGAE